MFLHCGHFRLDLSRPLVMGILNVTPDSFSDGGLHLQSEAAVAHALRLIAEGADLIDIGGESTRPGAAPVSVQEELDRVLPVIEGLRGCPVPLSIDTCKPDVMRAAIHAGIHMINDINALQNMAAMEAAAGADVAVCLMHKQGDPQSMQTKPHYHDVVAEVRDFLKARMDAALGAGIDIMRIAIDPGFGFGKTLTHNLALLRELAQLSTLGVPILAGLSRKSMLGELTSQDALNRMPACIAAALLAVQRGAAIVRVHDVRETADALKIWNAVNTIKARA
jgi:dihydropteroate synthase